MIKKCKKCSKIKNLSEFYKNKITKDGFQDKYKSCYKDYYQENKDHILLHYKEYFNTSEGKRIDILNVGME